MTPSASTLQPQRAIDELKELRALTGDAEGAQRVAFTDTWATARAWMRAKLEQLPVEITVDQAGNQWATLRGASDRELLIGGHIDSVPNGGWLDGCLGVLAGLEILRVHRAGGRAGAEQTAAEARALLVGPVDQPDGDRRRALGGDPAQHL